MDVALITVLTSALITVLGIGVAYFQWRRDVHIKLEGFREAVTVELVRQRANVYVEFFSKLEQMSTVHRQEIEENPSRALDFVKLFQNAIYSSVGLFASSDTREILVYARLGCKLYADGLITYNEWLQRIWSVHYAVRSDLGMGVFQMS